MPACRVLEPVRQGHRRLGRGAGKPAHRLLQWKV